MLCGEWLPFGTFLNRGISLPELLAGGYGCLGEGPENLMVAFGSILERYDLEPTYLTVLQAPIAPPTLLVLGDSWVVANDVQVRRFR
jgi:hypothetical protein